MRTFQPQMPPQMSAVDQYPQSGMRMPQVDAIRRARMGGQTPLYSAAEEVMGGTKPAMADQLSANLGATKPMMDPNARMGSKPMQEGFGAKPAPEMGGFNDPRLSKFGRKPARVGAPSGRGVPGIPGPAPRVREVM